MKGGAVGVSGPQTDRFETSKTRQKMAPLTTRGFLHQSSSSVSAARHAQRDHCSFQRLACNLVTDSRITVAQKYELLWLPWTGACCCVWASCGFNLSKQCPQTRPSDLAKRTSSVEVTRSEVRQSKQVPKYSILAGPRCASTTCLRYLHDANQCHWLQMLKRC